MALVNGRKVAYLSLADRALHYGDGLFETLAIERGQPLCVERHLQRLANGCQRLGIITPDRALLLGEVTALSSGVPRGILKILVTRGAAGRGYAPPEGNVPSRILLRYPWPKYPERYWQQGIKVCSCSVRLSRNRLLAGLKHLNRLEQVLARRECERSGCPEGLMRDTAGWVTEGTMSNLFLVKHNQLVTPSLSYCGVDGIMRSVIMDLVHSQGPIPLIVQKIRLHSLFDAEEIFFCNSVFGIWPVRKIGRRRYRVGAITRHLQHQLACRGLVAGL